MTNLEVHGMGLGMERRRGAHYGAQPEHRGRFPLHRGASVG